MLENPKESFDGLFSLRRHFYAHHRLCHDSKTESENQTNNSLAKKHGLHVKFRSLWVYRFSTFDSLTGPLLPSPSPFYTRLTMPGPKRKQKHKPKKTQSPQFIMSPTPAPSSKRPQRKAKEVL